MDSFTIRDKEEALQAITSMIERSEKAQVKLAAGTSSYTLQKNRIQALRIAFALISKECETGDLAEELTKADYEKAEAPLASLISKSEKAQAKLKQDSWQYKMLDGNLKALYMVMPLLASVLEE